MSCVGRKIGSIWARPRFGGRRFDERACGSVFAYRVVYGGGRSVFSAASVLRACNKRPSQQLEPPADNRLWHPEALAINQGHGGTSVGGGEWVVSRRDEAEAEVMYT